MQGAADGEIILQLHHNVLTHQGLEERVKQHLLVCVCFDEVKRSLDFAYLTAFLMEQPEKSE